MIQQYYYFHACNVGEHSPLRHPAAFDVIVREKIIWKILRMHRRLHQQLWRNRIGRCRESGED